MECQKGKETLQCGVSALEGSMQNRTQDVRASTLEHRISELRGTLEHRAAWADNFRARRDLRTETVGAGRNFRI